MIAFAEASTVPVAASFRRQDYVDNGSRAYAGPLTIGMDPALAQRVEDADVILALGTRLGEIATRQYSLLEPPRPRQRLIHVHADPAELGRVYEPELAIVSRLARVRCHAPAGRRHPPGRLGRAGARRLPRQPPATATCRATSSWPR